MITDNEIIIEDEIITPEESLYLKMYLLSAYTE